MGYKESLKIAGVSVALAGFLLTGQVSASQVQATLHSVSPSVSVTAATTVKNGGVGGGLFNFTQQSGAQIDTFGADKFISFCIDLADSIAVPSSTTWDLVDLELAPDQNAMGSKADDLAELFGENIDSNRLNDAATYLSDDELRAMQLAVWEVVNETSQAYSISTGNAQFTGAGTTITGLANGFLTAINGQGQMMQGLMALTKGDTQDFVVQAVPLPAAAWFFGSALLGAGFVSRRRKKQLAA